jgi:mannitol-specific phosphotransferase system IIBC component
MDILHICHTLLNCVICIKFIHNEHTTHFSSNPCIVVVVVVAVVVALSSSTLDMKNGSKKPLSQKTNEKMKRARKKKLQQNHKYSSFYSNFDISHSTRICIQKRSENMILMVIQERHSFTIEFMCI